LDTSAGVGSGGMRIRATGAGPTVRAESGLRRQRRRGCGCEGTVRWCYGMAFVRKVS